MVSPPIPNAGGGPGCADGGPAGRAGGRVVVHLGCDVAGGVGVVVVGTDGGVTDGGIDGGVDGGIDGALTYRAPLHR